MLAATMLCFAIFGTVLTEATGLTGSSNLGMMNTQYPSEYLETRNRTSEQVQHMSNITSSRQLKGKGPTLKQTVQAIYFIPQKAPRTNRADLGFDTVKRVQRQWSSWGFTFRLERKYKVIQGEFGCAAYQHRSMLGKIREEVKRKEPKWKDKKFMIFTECANYPGANGVVSQNFALVVNRRLDEIETERKQGRILGSTTGHELGHLFGLPHENCYTFQDEQDPDVQNLKKLGLPTFVTASITCTYKWPNLKPPAKWMRQIMVEKGRCKWFWECRGKNKFRKPMLREYGLGKHGGKLSKATTDQRAAALERSSGSEEKKSAKQKRVAQLRAKQRAARSAKRRQRLRARQGAARLARKRKRAQLKKAKKLSSAKRARLRKARQRAAKRKRATFRLRASRSVRKARRKRIKQSV